MNKRPCNSTDAVHLGTRSERPDHALTPAIAQTATYTFANTRDLENFFAGADEASFRQEYGRYGNPTTREVELRLAALDGADDALLFASGMAALSTTILALVKAGDHVVLFRDTYRRTRQFVIGVMARFGIEHTLVDPTDLDGLKRALERKTRLVVSEAPTNPYLRCVDLEALATICQASKAKTLIDATFATPINCRALDYGIDLVSHSATKYLGGHNDVLGGSVAGSRSLISLIRDLRNVLGGVMDPHAAALVGRGLKTLALRVRQQNASALTIAQHLEKHPAVERVYYPLLSSHPDHSVASQQLHGGGGVVSFEVRGGRAAASQVVDRTKLATLAPSLGGVETLIEQPAVMSFHELGDDELKAIGISPNLIRLAVGIEDASDLIADLDQALAGSPSL